MGAILNLDAARRLLVRALPAATQPYEREHFARPAGIAFAASVAFLLIPSTPLQFCFPPTLILACRYHELARFRAVRPSTWLVLLAVLCVAAATTWSLVHLSGGVQLFHLTVGASLLGLVFHLCSTQRRLAAGRSRRSRERDDDDVQWAFGGLLAGMPILFLLGAVGGVLSWRTPLVLAWGLSGLVVAALQLRRHRLFPRLAIAWLLTFLGIELIGSLYAGDAQGDEAFLAAVIVQIVVPVAAYLEFHPRVRRTFTATPSRHGEPGMATAPGNAVAHTRPARRRGANVPA